MSNFAVNKIVAFLQARTSSTRLPAKVLRPLLGEPMLVRQIERIKHSKYIDKLVVVTSVDTSDDTLAELCESIGVSCYRGSLNDVLARFAEALEIYPAEHVVRLTGDCPLTDWQVIDQVIGEHLKADADYSSNTIMPSFPDGLDVEVVKAPVLQRIASIARLKSEREHVTYYINSRPHDFVRCSVVSQANNLSDKRWTVDTLDDFVFVENVYAALYPLNHNFTTTDIIELLVTKPELSAINMGHTRNEGLFKSIAEDGENL